MSNEGASGGDTEEESKFRKRLSSRTLRINIERANSLASEHGNQSGAASDFCGGQEIYERGDFDSDDEGDYRLSDSDIIEEGRDLFENFVKEEIQREGLAPPVECFSSPSVRTPTGYRNPQWAKAGKELREMADAFARSKEREDVRRKANSVSIGNTTLGDSSSSSSITYDQFRDFLGAMLSDGLTRERIVVLFYFCSDLAIRTLRQNGLTLFRRLLQYSVRFISDTVCRWVAEHGGWDQVLKTSLQIFQYVMLGSVAAVLALVFIQWVRKRL